MNPDSIEAVDLDKHGHMDVPPKQLGWFLTGLQIQIMKWCPFEFAKAVSRETY